MPRRQIHGCKEVPGRGAGKVRHGKQILRSLAIDQELDGERREEPAMSRSQVRCLRETNDCVCTSLGKNSSVWCTRSRDPINLGDDTLRVNNLLAISGHFYHRHLI